MNKIPRQAGLFQIPDSDDHAPSLKGCLCKGCGFIIFPPQAYGCERCGKGSEHLEPMELKGNGRLKSFAAIHNQYLQPGKTPAVLGEVILDDGPVIQTMIVCKNESELTVGSRVRTILLENKPNKDGNIIMDCHFTIDKE